MDADVLVENFLHGDLSPRLLVADGASAMYAPFGQSGSGKSFHVPRYVFTSNDKKLFFDKNLFYDDLIARIFYMGMDCATRNANVAGNAAMDSNVLLQSDFTAQYRDPVMNALCAYRPDFLVEMQNGAAYIAELGDVKLTNAATLRAKAQAAKNLRIPLFDGLRCTAYIFIPRRCADMLFRELINADALSNRQAAPSPRAFSL